jgi:catechol 2,3-dioxygenase-like lactoylglutathione lyase family enzyme
MGNTQANSDTGTEASGAAPVPLRLEVVTLPVSDVDRGEALYQNLGWRLDADFAAGDDIREVQFTPPHSQCSIHFGKGLWQLSPGLLTG